MVILFFCGRQHYLIVSLVSNKFNKEKFAGRMGKVLQELKFHEHIDALCYTKEEFERKLKESYIVRDV